MLRIALAERGIPGQGRRRQQRRIQGVAHMLAFAAAAAVVDGKADADCYRYHHQRGGEREIAASVTCEALQGWLFDAAKRAIRIGRVCSARTRNRRLGDHAGMLLPASVMHPIYTRDL